MNAVSGNNSRTIAERANRWDGLQWWELEAALFSEYPKVRSALSTVSPAAARRYFAKGKIDPLQPLIALIYLAGAVLPAVALVVLASRHIQGPDGARFLPSAILIGIAALLGAISLIGNVRYRDEVEPRAAVLIGWVHLVPSLILLIYVLQALALDRATDAQVWMAAVFALDALIGVLYLVLTPRPKDTAAARVMRARARWQSAMAGLSPTEQARVREDLAEAISILLNRGLIDQETADRARSAKLGLLGTTLDSATR